MHESLQSVGGATFHPCSLEDAVRRARAEFLEMPGLKLTPGQAQRLWSLDEPTCRAVLVALVDAGFLTETRNAAYVRS